MECEVRDLLEPYDVKAASTVLRGEGGSDAFFPPDHPKMVADLLQGFVREPWVGELDFGSLEKMPNSYVADDLRTRADDVIWRVRWGQEWLYIYLLLEFQSTIDRFMAIRIMVYVGLLYQDLIRGEQWTAGQRLPPVLPMVIYNGTKAWDAPVEVGDLIEPGPEELRRYRPQVRYLLLDEGRMSESDLAPLKNVVAGLIRLENSRTPRDVEQVLSALVDWLEAPEQQSLRRAFTTWLKQVFLPGRMPNVAFAEMRDLQEVRSMLAERVIEWTQEWKQQGIEEGLQRGEAVFLLRLLERRFGPVEESLRQKILTTDAETLLVWGERVLTATTLADVVSEQAK